MPIQDEQGLNTNNLDRDYDRNNTVSSEPDSLRAITQEFASQYPQYVPVIDAGQAMHRSQGYSYRDYPTRKPRSLRHNRQVISPSISAAIEASRSILDLPDNWDDEGSPSYAESTWERATIFIKETTTSYRRTVGSWIGPPKITPGPDGSIDIRWKSAKRTLLINIPANNDDIADFYGDDKAADTIKGTLDTSSSNQWILMWLTR